ncbi:MAG: hypothetical protein AAF957_27240 [Planctomycetota bacterium]
MALLALSLWASSAADRITALVAPRRTASTATILRQRVAETRGRHEAMGVRAHEGGRVRGAENLDPAALVLKIRRQLDAALAVDAPWTAIEMLGPWPVARTKGYREFLALLEEEAPVSHEALRTALTSVRNGRQRGIIAMALGDLGVHRSCSLLASMAGAGRLTGERIGYEAGLFALSRLGIDEARIEIEALAARTSPDQLWSLPLHRAAGAFGVDALPFLRAEAARLAASGVTLRPHQVLGDLEGPGVYEALEQWADEGVADELASSVAYALGRCVTDATTGLLRARVDAATDAERRALLSGIGDRRTEASARLLCGWIETQTSPTEIVDGLAALRGHHGPRVAATLLDLLQRTNEPGWISDGERRVRDALICNLGEIRTADARDALRAVYERGDDRTRQRVLDSLSGEIGQEWEPLVLARLEAVIGGSPGRLGVTARALARIQGVPTQRLDVLRRAIERSSDERTRREVLGAVAAIEHPGVAGELLPVLEASEDLMTRVVGAEALLSASEPSATPGWREFERETVEAVLDRLESGRISQLLLTNPDTRLQFGEATRRLLGSRARPTDRERMAKLVERYRTLGETSSLSIVLQKAIDQLDARDAL